MELPPYSGSAFRGALGHAMRKVRYGMKPGCPMCPVRSECRYQNLYIYFFESPADHPFISENCRALDRDGDSYPQPFILDPPRGGLYSAGEVLVLPIVLVGKAVECFPFMACSLEIMEKRDLGKPGGRVVLAGITDGMAGENGSESLVYDAGTGTLAGPGQVIDFEIIRQWADNYLAEAGNIRSICIRFLTPFRFQDKNRPGTDPDFRVFMRNVFRRLILLSVHSPLSFSIDYQRLLEKAEKVEKTRSALRRYDQQRYSSRQKRHFQMHGLVGEIVFSGDLDEFLPYIKMCEFLNVGKGGTLGMGKYQANISV